MGRGNNTRTQIHPWRSSGCDNGCSSDARLGLSSGDYIRRYRIRIHRSKAHPQTSAKGASAFWTRTRYLVSGEVESLGFDTLMVVHYRSLTDRLACRSLLSEGYTFRELFQASEEVKKVRRGRFNNMKGKAWDRFVQVFAPWQTNRRQGILDRPMILVAKSG